MTSWIKRNWRHLLKAALLLICLYCFLLSIETFSAAFQKMGKGFSEQLIATTSNPFIGLAIGILVTSIIQSSSCTTSIVVSMVSTSVVSIENAIPIIMGANIGTTITNALVSMGYLSRRDEFRRAISASLVHDIFNTLCVIIFMTLELTTGFLRHLSSVLAENFFGAGMLKFASPLNTITNPIAEFLGNEATALLPPPWGAIVLSAFALAVLFFSLFGMVKVMRSAALGRFELLFDRFVGKRHIMALLLGLIVTAIIQSSSVTTSLMVPMAGAGILTIEQIYPVTLGANIGTTVTALLAALATNNIRGLQIAFVHSLFNICGVIIFFFIPGMKRLPIGIAKALGTLFAKKRYFAIIYIVTLFFAIPGLLILIHELS